MSGNMQDSTFYFFFFNDTATTEIYTLSLHDALPISSWSTRPSDAMVASTFNLSARESVHRRRSGERRPLSRIAYGGPIDRKSTRLNSSHLVISYAVFCLKKKKHKQAPHRPRAKRINV